MKVKSLNRVRLLATPWTTAYQAPPSMGFSRQEYWSGVPLPSSREVLASIIMVIRLQYINVSNQQVVHLKLTQYYFPGGSDGKASCLQCGRPGFHPWVGKIPWRRKRQPTPVLLPRKSHGRRSLVSMGSQRVGHD